MHRRGLILALALAAIAGGALASAPAEDAWQSLDWEVADHFEQAELDGWSSYRGTRRLLYFLRLPVSLGFYLLLLWGPIGPALQRGSGRLAGALASRAPSALQRLGSVPARVFGEDWAGALLFAQAVLLAALVVDLPFDVYSALLDRQEGLSNYTVGPWVWDHLKGQLLTAIVFSFLVFGLFGLVRRLPGRWWLALGLPAAILLSAWGLVSPYRSRVFNDLRPLEDAVLVERLRSLAEAEGFELAAVRVIDASRTSNALNAYVTGVGPSRELVLYDNLIQAMTPEEIEVAFAHELAHLRLENLPLQSVTVGLALLAFMWLMSRVLRWGSTRFGLGGPGDVRAFALLLLASSLLFLAASPVRNAWSRREEREADRIALALTRNPEAFVTQQLKLARHNHAEVRPPRWASLLLGSHPSIYERVGTGLWYRGWLSEQAGR